MIASGDSETKERLRVEKVTGQSLGGLLLTWKSEKENGGPGDRIGGKPGWERLCPLLPRL